jgi:hypothetical protein
VKKRKNEKKGKVKRISEFLGLDDFCNLENDNCSKAEEQRQN